MFDLPKGVIRNIVHANKTSIHIVIMYVQVAHAYACIADLVIINDKDQHNILFLIIFMSCLQFT